MPKFKSLKAGQITHHVEPSPKELHVEGRRWLVTIEHPMEGADVFLLEGRIALVHPCNLRWPALLLDVPHLADSAARNDGGAKLVFEILNFYMDMAPALLKAGKR